MNLLILSTWCPYPPDNGSRLRAFHLIRGLADRHLVRLVAGLQEDVVADVGGGGVPEPLRALCDDVELVPWRWYAGDSGGAWRSLLSLTPRSIAEMENPALRAAIARQLAKPTDAVLVLQQGIAPLIPANTPPAVLEEVEVTGPERTWRAARGAARYRHGLALWKANRYWRHAMRRYQAVTAVSEEEAEAVRRVLGRGADAPPVSVVPNGVDVRAYRRAPGRVVPGRLIYNGSLSYAPNRDAVRWFAEAILPRIAAEVPEAHLVVTGRDEGLAIDDLRANPRIHLTGFLPDLRPALDEAALCVVPLRAGGGTRLKVLEAWAAELPVVSTTLGAAGLGARDGENAALADTPEAFASAVVRLLREPDLAKMLARQARCVVEQRYDWSAIAEPPSDLLCAVASAAKRERAVS